MSMERRTLLKSGVLLAGGAFRGTRGLSQADYAKADAVALAEMIRTKQISPTDALAQLAQNEAG